MKRWPLQRSYRIKYIMKLRSHYVTLSRNNVDILCHDEMRTLDFNNNLVCNVRLSFEKVIRMVFNGKEFNLRDAKLYVAPSRKAQ